MYTLILGPPNINDATSYTGKYWHEVNLLNKKLY